MLINKNTAISTSNILLVPYEVSHVPTYHEWMKDEQIQAETASEPLTLEEEYAMQRSWRTDADKLTFIACLPLPLPAPSSSSLPLSSHSPPPPKRRTHTLTPGEFDSPTQMIGDVNLFLSPSDSYSSHSPSPFTSSSPSQDPETQTQTKTHLLTGELELMIAPLGHRKKGHGRNAILALLSYISDHLDEIMDEYGRGQEQIPTRIEEGEREGEGGEGEEARVRFRLEGLRVKIGVGNTSSLRLFRGLGFRGLGLGSGPGPEAEAGGAGEKEVPNYFGEVELWFCGVGEGQSGGEESLDDVLSEERMRVLRERFGVEGYEEMGYGLLEEEE